MEHLLMAERLGQEVDCSGLHRLDRHRNIAMTRHEDDRDVDTRLGQFDLKVEAAHSWQSDIEHQTTGDIRKAALQKFRGRPEHLDPQTDGPKKTLERLA